MPNIPSDSLTAPQPENAIGFNQLPDRKPPGSTVGFVGWVRANLFNSVANTILTLVALYFIYQGLSWFLNWGILNADLAGDSAEACTSSGACWVFIKTRFPQFIYGFYPSDEVWRINIMFALFAACIIGLVVDAIPGKKWIALFTLVVFPVIAYYLMLGGSFGLDKVGTHRWGGFSLTLILAVVGIVASLPIGIVLALGRRSEMPVVRSICITYIEFWRGVPLITVLFMASVMLPLFMTAGTDTDKLIRAMIGIIMFQSAYMAEVVRGGLQAIPKGQYEAAEALGLGYWKKTGLIILPQALKLMIPGIVNTFIALFKDTSLVLIIGLFDLLAIVQSAITDPNWPQVSVEGYLFVAFMFWICCFSMSQYSQRLERRFSTGHKQD
ncbi:amino acid ABC transporter permease [Allohahella sp. A8]|jgi:general L-amino acid transport system permease protein|uniref:amino acid ABC transporter permease n=1 Tax=Allohahella sp. A8 TaxID=3141461 RepID=UPI000C0AE795|nr:amino acid ABC transporter permease [Hahellaceae bacterium]|tara:strand:+ start:82230 stop:83378 length:1149 start_codon:yes stop_codon:yes gene_type:complete